MQNFDAPFWPYPTPGVMSFHNCEFTLPEDNFSFPGPMVSKKIFLKISKKKKFNNY